MARNRGVRQNFNFVKGWNTEASPMTFPENTALDLDNVILDQDGSIRRRGGAKFDSVFTSFANTASTSLFSTQAIAAYNWLNVAGQGSVSFVVTQFGNTLYFHRHAGPDTIDNLVGSVDFSSFAINTSESLKSTVSVASGLGYLFVVGKYVEPFYIEYNVEDGIFTTTQINIKIRDFDGLDDGLEISERPTTLSNEHYYNLLNQGWVDEGYAMSLENRGSSTIDVVTIGNPIQATFDEEQLGFYPSNADIMYLAKTSVGDSPDVIGAYRPFILENLALGNTPAPKGHFILDAFNKQRGTESGVSVPAEVLNNRPNTVAFHNGRVFYAGLTKTGRTGEIYFSQQLTNIDFAGKCYQEQDPTAEDLNALVATDGGVIVIPNCGVIVGIHEGVNGIVVFATNGVWEILGVDGKFSADSFFVNKVTDIGCIGPATIVNVDGIFMYWADAGIIALSQDSVTGRLSAQNVTRNTIQTGYLLFGGVQRKYARGIYVTEEKKVVWIYNTASTFDGINDRWKANGVLVFDTTLGAFYKYSVQDINADAAPYIVDIVKTSPYISETVQEPVTENGVIVTENGVTVTVGTEAFNSSPTVSAWKLLCVRPTYGSTTMEGLAFAEFNSRSFTDWYTIDGVGADYSSYIETGYSHEGNPMQDKKPTYVFTYYSPKSKSLSTGYYEFPELPTLPSFCGDVSTLTYSGLNGVLGDTPRGIFVRPDGLQAVILNGLSAERFDSYPLLTAWDISSIDTPNVVSYSVPISGNPPDAAYISPEGLNFYVSDNVADTIIPYTMSTAWDFTTAAGPGTPLSVSGYGGLVQNFTFSDDGTRLYLMEHNTTTLYQLNLSTAWDLSSASDSGNTLSITTSVTTAYNDVFISPDGEKLYIMSNNNLYYYILTTPFELDSAMSMGLQFTFTTLASESGVTTTAIWMDATGDLLWQANDSNPNRINQYDMECV